MGKWKTKGTAHFLKTLSVGSVSVIRLKYAFISLCLSHVFLLAWVEIQIGDSFLFAIPKGKPIHSGICGKCWVIRIPVIQTFRLFWFRLNLLCWHDNEISMNSLFCLWIWSIQHFCICVKFKRLDLICLNVIAKLLQFTFVGLLRVHLGLLPPV